MTIDHEERRDDEAVVRELRALLVHEAAVPLGMTARLEAAVARAAREHRSAWPARLVIASLAFTAAGLQGGAAFGAGAAAVTALLALGYAVAVGAEAPESSGGS